MVDMHRTEYVNGTHKQYTYERAQNPNPHLRWGTQMGRLLRSICTGFDPSTDSNAVNKDLRWDTVFFFVWIV